MKHILLLLFYGFPISLSAQFFCSTPAFPQRTNDDIVRIESESTRDYTSNYLLRVYFHVLRQVDGSGGVSDSVVQAAYSTLSNDYNLHNIFFFGMAE